MSGDAETQKNGSRTPPSKDKNRSPRRTKSRLNAKFGKSPQSAKFSRRKLRELYLLRASAARKHPSPPPSRKTNAVALHRKKRRRNEFRAPKKVSYEKGSRKELPNPKQKWKKALNRPNFSAEKRRIDRALGRAVRVRGSTTGAPKAHSAPSPRRFLPNSTRRRAAAPHFATPCPKPRAHATTAHPAPAHSRRPNPLVAPCAALPSTAAPPSCGENRDAKAPCANFPDTCRAWRSPFRGAPCVSARLAPVLG